MTKQLIVDPTNDNYAFCPQTAETLVAIRLLPDIPGRNYQLNSPTLAEIKAAPILGYGDRNPCTHTEES